MCTLLMFSAPKTRMFIWYEVSIDLKWGFCKVHDPYWRDEIQIFSFFLFCLFLSAAALSLSLLVLAGIALYEK